MRTCNFYAITNEIVRSIGLLSSRVYQSMTISIGPSSCVYRVYEDLYRSLYRLLIVRLYILLGVLQLGSSGQSELLSVVVELRGVSEGHTKLEKLAKGIRELLEEHVLVLGVSFSMLAERLVLDQSHVRGQDRKSVV